MLCYSTVSPEFTYLVELILLFVELVVFYLKTFIVKSADHTDNKQATSVDLLPTLETTLVATVNSK